MDRVKRPMNSFMVWSVNRRKILSQEYPNTPNTELSKRLGEEWRVLEKSDKTPYVKIADELLAKHKSDNPGYKWQQKKPRESQNPKKKQRKSKKMKLVGGAYSMPSMSTGGPASSTSASHHAGAAVAQPPSQIILQQAQPGQPMATMAANSIPVSNITSPATALSFNGTNLITSGQQPGINYIFPKAIQGIHYAPLVQSQYQPTQLALTPQGLPALPIQVVATNPEMFQQQRNTTAITTIARPVVSPTITTKNSAECSSSVSPAPSTPVRPTPLQADTLAVQKSMSSTDSSSTSGISSMSELASPQPILEMPSSSKAQSTPHISSQFSPTTPLPMMQVCTPPRGKVGGGGGPSGEGPINYRIAGNFSG